jgi:hypothetical protein
MFFPVPKKELPGCQGELAKESDICVTATGLL